MRTALFPVPFEEVELGRTVYRDGGSDYSINRTSCRLRDVLDLCRDTGLGANAYAIIENRMIDAILSDRAEERRGLFEEAAGIGKYKDRRKAALRRLERAELDLQRLDDVIGEVESKVGGLARQKGKAQRFQTLRDRRLAVEVAVVRHQLDSLEGRMDQVEKELAGDRELGEGYLAELRSAETQFETLRLRQVEVEQARSEAAKEVDRDPAGVDPLGAGSGRGRGTGQLCWQTDVSDRAGEGRDPSPDGGHGGRRGFSQGSRIGSGQGIRALGRRTPRDPKRCGRPRIWMGPGRSWGLGGQPKGASAPEAHLEGEADSAEAQGEELGRNLERVRGEMEEASHALSDVESPRGPLRRPAGSPERGSR